MPRALVDFHHQALYHSLYLLFEKRLGWELYRAIGPEWYPDYWMVYNHPATVDQFLGYSQGTKMPRDVHGVELPEHERKNLNYRVEDGIYYIDDPSYKTTHRAVSLDKFKQMKFDVVLSSIPAHIPRYNNLVANFQPQAKHIFQVGNAWGHQPGINNILASTAPFSTPAGINTCFYHQEFDLQTFRYEPPTFHQVVNSYVHYMKRPELMDQVAAHLPGWTFTKYGAGMDLAISTGEGVALAMRNSAFNFLYKPEGDGYGHVAFTNAACGRPSIIWKSHYRGKLAEKLYIDNLTCIDADNKTPRQIAESLEFFSEPERHKQMCLNTFNRFKELVDFDQDSLRIQKFLENLV